MGNLIAILIPILIAIESGGNDLAVGDHGKAFGCLQIRAKYWQDGCKALGVNWPHKDAFDRQKSILVATAALQRYAKHYERKMGKPPTIEVLARFHNGGYKWAKNGRTDAYWAKAKRRLK